MKNSHIEWTDHTFNPWEGCTRVSPGCAHCYAEARNQRFAAGANWGPGAPRRRTSPANWKQPSRWNADYAQAKSGHDISRQMESVALDEPSRPRVFCASLADWLDDEVPIEWLADLLDLIRRTPNLDWLLLTKRPQNWDNRVGAACSWMSALGPFAETKKWLFHWLGGLERENHRPPANVWIGTTVEDQQRADERIPVLLSIPAKVRFLSCEPLLGPVSLVGPFAGLQMHPLGRGINWVIAGGESGPGARPMHPDWARGLRDQCSTYEVPFFFKQWGEYIHHPVSCATYSGGAQVPADDQPMRLERVGKLKAGRLLDGKEHNARPTP